MEGLKKGRRTYFDCCHKAFENGHTAGTTTTCVAYSILAWLLFEFFEYDVRMGEEGFG